MSKLGRQRVGAHCMRPTAANTQHPTPSTPSPHHQNKPDLWFEQSQAESQLILNSDFGILETELSSDHPDKCSIIVFVVIGISHDK